MSKGMCHSMVSLAPVYIQPTCLTMWCCDVPRH